MHKINTNDQVYVKLTETGKKILNSVPGYKDFSVLDSQGYYKFHLWELMQIFGEAHYIGCREVPFENNEICFPE